MRGLLGRLGSAADHERNPFGLRLFSGLAI